MNKLNLQDFSISTRSAEYLVESAQQQTGHKPDADRSSLSLACCQVFFKDLNVNAANTQNAEGTLNAP